MEGRFKIIVFSSPAEVDDEAAKLTELLDRGVDFLHIRKPGWSHGRIDRLLSELPTRCHHRIKLHDCQELALKYPGIGVNLNSRCPLHDFSGPVSAGVHSLEEIESIGNAVDYLFLSPVYDSISKSGYQGRFNSTVIAPDYPYEVIALGGVTVDRLEELCLRGFAGAALLGEVWETPNGVDRLVKAMRMRNGRLQVLDDGDDPDLIIERGLQAVAGGCRWIQVRMKNATEATVSATVARLMEQVPGDVTVIVDDHVEVAPLCHGVHLGQNDMDPAEARRRLGTEAIIGLTLNTADDLRRATTLPVDYYGIGPFRFTSTKKKLSPVLGLEGYVGIMSARRALNDRRPFVAIGGITRHDVGPLLQAGVPGIAVSGAIAKAPDPIEATRQIITEMNIRNKIYII